MPSTNIFLKILITLRVEASKVVGK